MTAPLIRRMFAQPASIQLDGSGNGIATVSPPTGSFWLPTTVRVATRSSASPTPYAQLFHGPAGLIDQTQFVDDTFNGNGDSSSMLAGTIVQYGEAIKVKWTNGVARDTAFMNVYGIEVNYPPGPGDLPAIPGTHFSGKLNVGNVSLVTDIKNSVSTLITYPLIAVPAVPYVLVQGAAVLGHIAVQIRFFADAAGTVVLSDYDISARQGDNYAVPVKTIGPYFQATVAPGSITPYSYILNITADNSGGGLSATQFEPSMLSQASAAIGAGATLTFDNHFVMPGRIYWSCFVTGGNFGAGVATVSEVGTVTNLDALNNSYTIGGVRTLVIPSSHIQFQVTNNNAAAQVFNYFASREWFDHF